jgi:hypothetical protein
MKEQFQLKSKFKPAKDHKKQGLQAETGNLSPRGIGSTFAYAVANMQEDAKEISQNKEAYLGKEKKTVDAKQYAHSLVDQNRTSLKNKKGEI